MKPKAPRKRRPKRDARLHLEVREVDAMREELERTVGGGDAVARWNADPAEVQRSVAKLVLTVVELVRQLLERQAIRRMENDTLTPVEVENVGLALMRLEETIAELARQFGVDPADLNLSLGPLGRLL